MKDVTSTNSYLSFSFPPQMSFFRPYAHPVCKSHFVHVFLLSISAKYAHVIFVNSCIWKESFPWLSSHVKCTLQLPKFFCSSDWSQLLALPCVCGKMRAHSHYFGSALSGVWIGENLVVEISLSFIYFFLCKFRCVCFYLSLRALYRRNEVQAIAEYWRLLVFTAMALEDLKLSCASVRHVTIETLKI